MQPRDMTTITIAIMGIAVWTFVILNLTALVGGAELIHAIITRPWR